AERVDGPRSMGQYALAEQADVGDGRQQQRVGPDQRAERHAGDRAAGGGAPPEQTAKERWGELSDRRERQDADRKQLRLGSGAIVQVGEQQDDEDRQPANPEEQRTRGLT